jgi:hypothetical protein
MVELGKLVPYMTLVAMDGTTYKLSQLARQVRLSDVWRRGAGRAWPRCAT